MPDATVSLSNDKIEATFDSGTGALVSLRNPQTGWDMQGRAGLAGSFETVVPLPERLLNVARGNTIPPIVTRQDDAVTFRWDGLIPDHSERLDVVLEATARLEGAGLRFDMKVTNRSTRVIESIAFPIIGDLTHAADSTLERATVNYCNMQIHPLYPEFRNERGYWGTEFPIALTDAPTSPFNLVLSNTGEGLYIGCHDPLARELVEFSFELRPGFAKVNTVPDVDEIEGRPVHQIVKVQHFPFVQPGQTFELSSIFVAPFEGDWHQGADIYKDWRAGWMVQRKNPDWVNEVHSWQQVQMTSWGDSLNYTYPDLVQFGRDCVANGVSAIQLVGWTLYGQDGRLPIHDIDPRLGTREELRDAIAAVQDMGVKVILYEKYSCADKTVPWYREELHRYASKDVFGNAHGHEGWRYDTPAHLAGVNIRPYAWMCMTASSWQDVALAEIEKSLDLGAAGLLLDESQSHGSSGSCCFDPTHDHRPGAYNFGGDAIFEKRLLELLDRQPQRQLLAGEGCYDLQFRHYGLAYHRTNYNGPVPGHIPVARYIDPFVPMMNWVWGYDDRENLNICLLYRYIISYEPRHFRGRLAEFPLTVAYGKKIDALRKRYAAYVWEATFRHTIGATVEAAGESYRLYSVFEGKDGQRAVVVANHNDEPLEVQVTLDRNKGRFDLVSPESPDPVPSDGRVTIPARSVVVLLQAA